ncbi:unnamed protein product [Pocillopora meandrina]|uniref:Vitellogenin n=1 Tax=Pocillopora meandrina TaxID=46732 RepID=A0AAU9XTE1_9CNID|nr:unnamed protein product [Pocillopora meandrina]
MKVFALLLFAGVSLAHYRGSTAIYFGVKDENIRKASSYKKSHTYTYEYVASVNSGFPETEERYAGLKITCDTDFYFETDTLAYLKIRNPILYEVNVTSFDQSESHTVSPVSNELKPLLERPLKFEYKEGKVGQIFCNDDEPEYILNIKRGVLSMIHHNFTKPESSLHHREPRLYKNWEFSTHGMCENLYDVRHNTLETNTIKELQITKTLNLHSCIGKPRVFSNVPGMRCLSEDCSVIDEPLQISVSASCDLFGTEEQFVVKDCRTMGRYIFAPTQMKGDARTLTKQYLKFKEVRSESQSYTVSGVTARTLEMTVDEGEDKPETEEQRTQTANMVTKLIDDLIKSVEENDLMSWQFSRLVETLRRACKKTLIKIWDNCYNDEKRRQWLLEALPYVYKEEVFELISEKIKTLELDSGRAVSLIRGLALTPNPTEQMCLTVVDLCSGSVVQADETLKKTCYLTAGALMHDFCKDKDVTCLPNQVAEIKSRLQYASYREKIFILKGIGNFGHRDFYQPLLEIIKDNRNSLELRVTAVYALRRIAPKISQKVLPVLLEIFRQPNNDAELRMACFVIICDCKPGPAVFNLVVKQLYYERTNQVRSFVVSYIKGMAFSRYPCDEKMAQTARIALRIALRALKRYKINPVNSKWLHFGDFSDLLQMGSSVDLRMISTPSSFIPRAINSKVKLHTGMLGKSLNLFETGIRGEGIQELLQRVMGPRGHYSEDKSLFGLLRPKRSLDKSLNGKEIKEIQYQLPTAEHEEEKAKGSFYFKVFGKELFYNYFTYDDVKELIEDGVIRVSNDLKDLLKKGKKWNMSKILRPIEVKIRQPSCAGLPLDFSVDSVLFLRLNTTVKAEVQPRFFIPLPDQVTLSGKLNVSVLHSLWGKMKVSLPQLETGSKLTIHTNITTGLGGKFQCNLRNQSYTTEMDLPQERQEILSTSKASNTWLMYRKPVTGSKNWSSVYRSTELDGFEIGEVTEIARGHHHHRYANWTLKAGNGKYLSVNEHNELVLSELPTVFKVYFIDGNHQFVKLFVTGKGFVKVRPNSQGCLETVHDNRYPKLFKITFVNGRRHVRLATVVYIHKDASKNPVEWTRATVPMNTDQVTLFQHMIEDIEPQKGYEEKWRYISDLPLNSPSHNAEKSDGLHPRHMKIVFVTPVGSKLCLRPSQTKESVLSVKRHHTNSSELCYGKQMLGFDVCLSGRYIMPHIPHPPAFPFSGPARLNIFVQPSRDPAQKIQLKFGKGDRFNEHLKTWKAGIYLQGTNPEKKIEADVSYDVDNQRTDVTVDIHNMYPWLRKVCIVNQVTSNDEVEFDLRFGENCLNDYEVQTRISIKEPSRRQLNIVTSYNKLPEPVLMMCYKLLKKFSQRYYHRLSDWEFARNEPNKVEFVVKFQTDQLVDLQLNTPSHVMTMEDVEFKSQGFLPRGSNYYNTFMHVSTPVCTVEQDTLKTFDDVEIQHTLPDRCMHVLAKDCTKNNSFIVLMSKDTRHPDKKIIEILVEQEKIRIAHLGSAGYQIQVNGKIQLNRPIRHKNIATIIEEPASDKLHVLCDIGLQVEIVRGSKINIRVSRYYFDRTCGMCGDCNAEQFRDLKTPQGKVFTDSDNLMYGRMWMVTMDTCKAGCNLKKEYLKVDRTINGESHDCYPTSPVLRCHNGCQATKTRMTSFPMTCVETGTKESQKISANLGKPSFDLTGSVVYFRENLEEETECNCSSCQ